MSLPNRQTYYSLTITAQGASTAAYYALTPAASLQFAQGGATLYPSAPSQQMISVSVYPQTLTINAAAGTVNGGANIVTSASEIAGSIVVSPPVNVAVVVTLYGNGGVQLGQKIVDPGVSNGAFAFPVDGNDGISEEEAPGELQKLLEKQY